MQNYREIAKEINSERKKITRESKRGKSKQNLVHI